MSSVADAHASPLRHPPFALFWFSRGLSTIAFQMQAVAVGWQMYALTGSAFDLGLVGLVQFLPMVALTLLVGHVADRYDRRRIVAICQLLEGVAVVALAAGSIGGWLGREGIFALVALIGAARAFESPSMAALLPNLVPRPLFQAANAWSASANQTAQIVGPAIGGGLYAFGAGAAYGSAAALFLLAAGLTTAIRMETVVRARQPLTLESLFSGVAFIRRNRILLGTLSLDLFAVLLGGAVALLPIYARDILETGPWGLGLLRAAPALGALIMSLILATRPFKENVGRKLFVALVVFGVATVVFGLSTSLPLSLAALFALGAADMVSVVIRFSLVQLRTPDEMRGRVSAINSLFIGASNQLGEFRAGSVAALIGAVPSVVLGGVGTVFIAWLWMLHLFPELMRIRTLED
jgi:MFS family permease